MNQVALNQLVVRFGGDDGFTREVVDRLIRGGECHPSATVWRGVAAMRISVSNWSTDDADIDRTLAAVARAAGREPC